MQRLTLVVLTKDDAKNIIPLSANVEAEDSSSSEDLDGLPMDIPGERPAQLSVLPKLRVTLGETSETECIADIEDLLSEEWDLSR